MPSDERSCDRRRVLQLTGLALGGLATTGSAAAKPGRGRGRGRRGPPEHAGEPGPPTFVEAKNGQLELTTSEQEWLSAPPATEIDEIPDTAEKLPYGAFEAVVENLNERLEDEGAELHSRGGVPAVELGDSPATFRGDGR